MKVDALLQYCLETGVSMDWLVGLSVEPEVEWQGPALRAWKGEAPPQGVGGASGR